MKQPRKPVLNLAHRGAMAYAPENTLSAFRLAKRLGADGFEFDVQLSKDGIPVVIHDETLDRTTTGKGLVQEHSLDELRRLEIRPLDAHAEVERIPTLEEVLREFHEGTYLNIELKNSYCDMPELEEKTVQQVLDHVKDRTRVLISSFDHGSIRKLQDIKKRHALAPAELPCGLLYDCRLVDAPAYASACHASALHPDFNTLKKSLVQEAGNAGLAVNVWTVNKKADMRRLIAMDVDAIITNHPDRLAEVLEEKREQE